MNLDVEATDKIEKIKTRISKMLATAGNDASTSGEKATAMQMASALMRKYNLERDDIDDHNNPKNNFDLVAVEGLWARLTPWESRLAVFISSYVVKSIFVVGEKKGGTGRLYGSVGQSTLTFSGSGPDAEIAAETYKHLRMMLMSQCGRKFGTPVRGPGRSYAVGFVTGLYEAAKNAEKLEQNKVEVNRALIRTDMLKTASREYYIAETNANLRTTNSRIKVGHSRAYQEGVADGSRADSKQRAASKASNLLY